MKKYMSWIIPILVGVIIWFMPVPEGLKPQAWHLCAIFAGTILGFILQPLPIGALSIISIVITAVTNTLKIGDGLGLRVLADSDRFHNQHPAGDCSHRMGSSTNT